MSAVDPPTAPKAPRTAKKYRSLDRSFPLRFTACVLAAVYSVLVCLMDSPPPESVQMLVLGLFGAFLGVDTVRPSNTVRDD